MKDADDATPPPYGLNSKLTKRNGEMVELVWKEDGLYGEAIREIVSWLLKAQKYAENEGQKHVIDLLVKFYRTGNLEDFDRYSIAWVQQHEGMVDFINGFIEVYGDPQSYGLVQLCLFDSALELQRFGRPMGAPTAETAQKTVSIVTFQILRIS